MSYRIVVMWAVLVIASAWVGAANADGFDKGHSVIWVGLNGNRSHIVSSPASLASLGEENEYGVHLAYSYFLSKAWAGVLSGGFDFGNQKFEPSAGGGEDKFESSSYNLRLGLDRYAFINDNVAIYAGPGVLFWSGDSKITNSPAPEVTWPRVDEWAFNGRLGMYARLGERFGLFGHIGQTIGVNSADETAGKVTWWTSHHEGSVGLAIDF